MRTPGALPELLCPAGSPEALRAAVESGADAVYFGGPAFHARMRAPGFDETSMREGIALCHAFGARAYITLNTLCRDIELPAFLRAAELAWHTGADALIVADLGGAALLRRFFPEFELHASTQMSVHDLAGADMLRPLGFSRIVLARETPARDIRRFVRESGVETEVFVHGALCVSHSGQCLFSSLVGGRSGNRGECAQPCRLPDKEGKYPLSLKDLSLAGHIPELIDMGVDSLKIEGRLKSPEYVRDVTAVFRKLLDERRAASGEEMQLLAGIFSRGGFTDGYFTEHVTHAMLGTRSEKDKAQSREQAPFAGLTRRVPLELSFTMKAGEPLRLSATARGRTVCVAGEIPFAARTTPMDEATVGKNLCKLGGTPYALSSLHLSVEGGLMVPLSRLNDLRRRALEALTATPRAAMTLPEDLSLPVAPGTKSTRPTARFYRADQIFPGAERFFAHIYLPPKEFAPPADGVILPPVILDHEVAPVSALLQKAAERGAKHALVGNVGHLPLALGAGLVPHGDFRLNITNGQTLAALLSMGFVDALLSPELTLPQIRDIRGACDAIVYGRIPLMLLEKCVGKEVGDCTACAAGKNQYTDRRGEKFPVLRVSAHRNELLNCRPTVMSDRRTELAAAGLCGGHFLFTTETADEAAKICEAYQKSLPLMGEKRRI